ncbi:MAG: tetratricopeptide repeat protein [Limnochordaceae bacterium]|nr:tetratricopeptide repeat protein [Limnochordaceae bacterium]
MFFNRLRKQMKWIISVIVVTFAVGLAYVGGAGLIGRASRPTTVAIANGHKISFADLQVATKRMVDLQSMYYGVNVTPALLPEVQYQALQDLINQVILADTARKQKVTVDKKQLDQEVANQEYLMAEYNWTKRELRRNVEDQLLAQKLLDSVKGDVKVSDADVARAYERITASQIVIKPKGQSQAGWDVALKLAQDVVKKARGGENFATLAKTYSDDEATKMGGGLLGEIGHDKLPAAVDTAAFALKPGQVTDPVKGPDGYYIIQVTKRVDASGPDFEKQKEQLRQQLADQKGQDRINQWFAQIRAAADVKILDTALAARDLVSQGRLDEAIAQYKKAIEKDPSDPYLHVQLGQVYQIQGQKNLVLSEFETAAGMAPNDAEIQYTVGSLYKDAGKKEQAIAALSKASELDPNNFQMHLQLAQWFKDLGRDDLAKKEDATVSEILKSYQQQQQAQQAQQPAQSQSQSQSQSQTQTSSPAPKASPAQPQAQSSGQPSAQPQVESTGRTSTQPSTPPSGQAKTTGQ